MESLFYLKSVEKTIDGHNYYEISILDLKNCQIFKIYKIIDQKSTNFVKMHKQFDNLSNCLTFVIKRNNKISFDIK